MDRSKFIFLSFFLALALSSSVFAVHGESDFEAEGLEIAGDFVAFLDERVLETLEVARFGFSDIGDAKKKIKAFSDSHSREIWFNIGTDNSPSEEKEIIPIYSEISFINKNGNEFFRYSDGKFIDDLRDVSVVSNTEFGSETYFRDSIEIGDGNVFIGNIMTKYIGAEEVFKNSPENVRVGKIYENVLGRDVMKTGVIRFSSPVYSKGVFVGVVVLSLDYRHFQDLSKHFEPGNNHSVVSTKYSGNYLLVFDNEGNTITHPKPDNVFGYLDDGELAGFNEPNSTREGGIFNLYKYKKSTAYNDIAKTVLEDKDNYFSSATDLSGRTKVVVAVPILYSNPKTNYVSSGVFGGIMTSIQFIGGTAGIESNPEPVFVYVLGGIIITLLLFFLYLGYSGKWFLVSKLNQKLLMWFLLVAIIPLIFISFILLQGQTKTITEIVINSSTEEIRSEIEFLKEILHDFEQEIKILSLHNDFGRLIERGPNMEEDLNDVREDFLEILKEKPEYYQLRYIDEKGDEIIRVDNKFNETVLVSEKDLQNKKGRYYFENTMALSEGGLFVSPLDLNIEEGKLENRGTENNPEYIPVIRYAIPVFDISGNKKGIIILNVYANVFLDYLIDKSQIGSKNYLLNSRGDFLLNPEKYKEFSFMFEDREYNFQGEHGNEIFEEAILGKQGIYHSGLEHYILFERIEVGESFWILVEIIDENILLSDVNALRDQLLMVGIFLMIFVAFISYFFSRKITKPIKELYEGSTAFQKRDFSRRVEIKTGDELEALGTAFNQTAMALEHMDKEHKQLENAKTEFLSITSHELRSPMTPMKAQLQMLRKEYFGKLNAKQKQAVDIVERNTSRLDNIIVDFLEISRIEAARLKFRFVKADLTSTIKRLAKEMTGFMPEKKIKIFTKIEKLPEIMVDPDRVSQILRNLVNNAIKFSRENTKIVISAKLDGNKILFSVSDSGEGIGLKDQKRIFEPFFQAEQTIYREHSGTGLGLAIVKGIVESQNGKIWLVSNVGKGTIFYFTIPLKPMKVIKPIKLLFSEGNGVDKKVNSLFLEIFGAEGQKRFDLLEKGNKVNETSLKGYIDILLRRKVIDDKKAQVFKKRLLTIFSK